MEDFGLMLGKGVDIFSTSFELWGYNFDFWHLFLYITAGSIIIDIIRRGLD